MSSEFDASLLCISLSDSESESSTPAEAAPAATRADRTALSEEAFQHLQATYQPKVENGEIWKTITFPIGCTKPEWQEVLHAVEELYFFRRYEEAALFVERIFSEETGKEEKSLDADTQKLLRLYEDRARARMGVVDNKEENITAS